MTTKIDESARDRSRVALLKELDVLDRLRPYATGDKEHSSPSLERAYQIQLALASGAAKGFNEAHKGVED